MQSARFRAFRHVSGRAKLSEREFADKFFSREKRDVALKVLRLLAPYIAVSPARVYPSDLLVDDLGLAAGLSDGLDEVAFVRDLEAEFNVEFGEDDYLHMLTFRDAVEIVAAKISMDQTQSPKRFARME